MILAAHLLIVVLFAALLWSVSLPVKDGWP